MSKPEKKKMVTSREVYHRIIWDARLNSSAFIVGFQERMSSTGVREKPLAQWATDGDIPWHRIRYIRCGDVVVWDREQHLDLISTGQLPPAAWKPNATREKNDYIDTLLEDSTAKFNTVSPKTGYIISPQPPFSRGARGDQICGNDKENWYNTRPVYKYDMQGWQAYELSPASVNLDTFTVASFNVLCNLYETEKIQTQKRLPVIVEHLRQLNADIIAIQEATPPLVELLLSQGWVRNYYISESITAQGVQPYGNLLLSRLPFTLVEHQFSGHKRVLVGTWQINSKSLHVAVVHLTSDRTQNAVEIRKHQLSTILAYHMRKPGNCLIVGDFNTRSNEQEEILTSTGFVDVWQELHPYAAGYTFDPQRNPLAALMSLQGQPARFDRILLRSQNNDLIPQSIDLFACEAIAGTEGNLYPSDHFGICAVLKSSHSPNPELIQIINQLEPELTQAQQLQRDTVLEVVRQACAECLGFQPSLHLLGSARLGVQSPQSDLDVVCLIPTYLSGETFLLRVQQRVFGLCDRTQVVLDAIVPVLRLRLEGISLDLLYARMKGYENWELDIKTLQNFDPTSLKAIVGCWEADLIVDVVCQHVTFDSFRLLLRAVRAWAKARQIYGNACGFLGGFSWALLCAWSCTCYVNSDAHLDALLVNFFQLLNKHDWNQAIALTDAGRKYKVELPRDQLPIVTSIEPCQNTARNVTRSTAQILQNEFARGAAVTEQIKAGKLSWASLFEPTNLQIT